MEPKKVKISDLRPGPIQHHDLPADLLGRIETLWHRVRDGYGVTLETFEIGFMRDLHPEREVALWECIADAYEAAVGRVTNAPTPEERAKLLGTIVAITTGAYSDEQLSQNETLSYLANQYLAAKGRRGL